MFKKINNFILGIDFTSRGLLGLFIVYLIISSFVLTMDFSYMVKTPVALFNYMVVLGGLSSTLIGLKYKDDKLTFVVLSAGLSIVGLMIWGLFINFTLPFFGILKPFASIPLVSSLFVLVSSLAVWVYIKNQNNVFSFSGFKSKNGVIYTLIPFAFLIISLLGTGSLNNTGNNYLLLLLYPFIAGYFAYLFLSKKEFSDSVYFSVLYFSALSLLFTFSLRGHNILGWDINEEFQVFSGTLENLRWSMSYYKGLDYNACISITILPTIFKVLTGITSQYIFKFLFQVFFALLPVSVFVISKKYLNVKYAFASAMLFLSQTWFFEQMPALIRQEIAFLLYSFLVVIVFKVELTNRLKYILVAIFSVGIVISHYTTSYILIAIFGAVFLGNIISQRFQNQKTNSIIGYILVFVLVLVMFWQVVVTNTGDAFGKFISFKDRKGIEETATTTVAMIHTGLQDIVEENLNKNPSELNIVYFDVVKKYLAEQDKTKYDFIEASKYVPKALNDVYYSESLFPLYVDSFVAFLGKALKLLMLVLLPIFGLYTVIKINFKNKNFDGIDYLILNATGILLLSVMVLIPFLQIHYNITRLFLQVFITLSLFVVIGLKYISDKVKWSKLLVASSIVVLFLFQSGFIGHFTGEYKRITLHTIPSDFYTYYINDTEIASAKWLGRLITSEDKIQADNIANLRLQSFGNTNSYNTKIFPLAIRKDSFMYLIKVNVVDKMAVLQYNNVSYMYEYPIEYIGNNKNLIYSNGDSLIFK